MKILDHLQKLSLFSHPARMLFIEKENDHAVLNSSTAIILCQVS